MTVTSVVETDNMESNGIAVERGSGSVFADLGLPDADAHLVKAEPVSRIDDMVRNRGITQTEAVRLPGLSQPDVSRSLRGDFREHSLERLFRLLTTLGRDVDIVIRQPRSADGEKLRIALGLTPPTPPIAPAIPPTSATSPAPCYWTRENHAPGGTTNCDGHPC